MARIQVGKRGISDLSKEQLENLIKQKAHEICMKRGCKPGNDWSDWFEAEKQIKEGMKLK